MIPALKRANSLVDNVIMLVA